MHELMIAELFVNFNGTIKLYATKQCVCFNYLNNRGNTWHEKICS